MSLAAAFTMPAKLLLALLRIISSAALNVAVPATTRAPDCLMSPVLLVALSVSTVAVPRFRSPLAKAVKVLAEVVPSVSAPPVLVAVTLPAVVTDPSVSPPTLSTTVAFCAFVMLTVPTKLLLVPFKLMSAGFPAAVAVSVVGPATWIADPDCWVIAPPLLTTESFPEPFTIQTYLGFAPGNALGSGVEFESVDTGAPVGIVGVATLARVSPLTSVEPVTSCRGASDANPVESWLNAMVVPLINSAVWSLLSISNVEIVLSNTGNGSIRCVEILPKSNPPI